MEQFTNLYQLQKTLRFDIIPTEETLEILKEKGVKKSDKKLLEADKKRDSDFHDAQKVIDRYHRYFINSTLDAIKNDSEIIDKLRNCSNERGKDELRKIISDYFQKDSQFNRLFGKELFAKKNEKKDVEDSPLFTYAKTKNEKNALESFVNFTVFFKRYNENRKNMYVDKKQTTAIAYRIANVNLPKFEENNNCFLEIKKTKLMEILNKNRQLKKLLKGKKCEEVFRLDYYINVWKQTEIDEYNEIVGIINTNIKQYNDTLSGKKKSELPLMKKLHKQILGFKEEDKNKWEYRGFDSDKEMLTAVREFYSTYELKIKEKLRQLLETINDFDLSGIHVHQKSLRTISSFMFDDGYAIARFLIPQKSDETYEDYKDRIKKGNKSFTIKGINKKANTDLCQYFSKHSFIKVNEDDEKREEKEIFETINIAYENAKEIIDNANNYTEKNLAGSGDEQKLRTLLDNLKALQHFVQPLLGKGDEKKRDCSFYNKFMELWEDLLPLNILYDKVRSHMTKKPFSKEKIKVIFDVKKDFLNGWTDNMTKSDNGTQYGGFLFRKKNSIGEYDYFLGICKKAWILRKREGVSGDYERLDYYQINSRTFYKYYYYGENGFEEDKNSLMKAIKAYLEITAQDEDDRDLLEDVKAKDTPIAMITIIQERSQSKLSELLNDKCFADINKTVIENLRKSILSLSRIPEAQDYKDKEYYLFSDIQQDIEELCRTKRIFDYFYVCNEEIRDAQNNKESPLLLFKISNKDLSYADTSSEGKRKSRGTENLHTMYFKALMEGKQNVFDLGSGQIFFRESSLKRKVTHPAGIPIDNKNELVCKQRPTRILNYDLIKDKRYTIDKYLFHLSVKINYPQKELPKPENKKSVNDFIADFNKKTIEYLRQNKQDINIIGIDRGERNLIYVSLINAKGEHVTSDFPRSYNLINNFDYQKKLKQVAKNRDEERKNWTIPEKITDIKKGYLSQVVHEIASLAVRHHAIIVMENLSRGFKHGRFPIEHQVYQLFENMLIEKLSYFAFKKDWPSKEYGNIKNGVQLAVPMNKEDWVNQNGWLFYVPAGFTSKIDPATGFVNLFNMSKPLDNLKEFFGAFDEIAFRNGLFYFKFNYSKETFHKIRKDFTNEWTLTSHGERIEKKRPEDLTSKFKSFFAKTDVNIPLENVSVESVCSLSEDNLKELWGLFKLMLKMRNSSDDQDFIISPVASETPFVTGPENYMQIANADANGAYNIALKGLYWLYYNFPTDEKGYLKYIKDEDWFRFIQTKPYCNK